MISDRAKPLHERRGSSKMFDNKVKIGVLMDPSVVI